MQENDINLMNLPVGISTPYLDKMDKTEHLASKYTLLDLIGTGGMAEVYRAKLVGQRGFEKPLVIKQLLAEVVGDAEVVTNFIDEARLAALLQHENIACVYDFGEQDGSYFIAMEYLFGKDLYSVMAQAKNDNVTVGVSLALYIAAQICAGMEYAHNLTDMQQQPLHLIHRDLTPHNVFLTYEGKVKIIDFGVAKAELFDNRTRAGVVKGKVSYMSPEQLVEGDVDSRSDIFSIGILLYEMLSSVRMYQGDTATLIRKCINVEFQPLEEVLPDADPLLCEILHKALQKDTACRYQSCGEMRDDINEYLAGQGLRPDDKALKKLLFSLFRTDYEAEIQRLSPGGTEAAGSRTKEVVDDDKTVFVPSPYARKTPTWMIPLSRTSILAGLGILGCVLVLASINMVLDKRKISGEVTSQDAEKTAIVGQTSASEKKAFVNIAPLQVPVEVVVEVEKEINDEDIMARAAGIFLGKAETALKENKLTLPRETSAYTYYKKVLDLEPLNPQAKNGMHSIAEKYADFASRKLSEGDVKGAKERIIKGLGVMSENQKLLALQQQIADREKAEIKILLQKAEKAFAESRYTSPKDDCAYRYYLDIEKIRPGSPLVKNGVMAIADRYTSMGDEAMQNLNLKKARIYVATGLRVAPQHQGLLELQADLQKSKPAIFIKGLGRSIRPLFK